MRSVIDAMINDGTPYKGVLYAGFMITRDNEPKILEFNCRFGDPETQVLLPLLKTDLFDVCLKCATGKLNDTQLEFESKRAACIVLASKGYPGSFQKNLPIKWNEEEGVQIFHAGLVKNEKGEMLTSGGRLLSVVAVENSHFTAISKCLRFLERLQFSNGHYRRDIGHFVLGN